MVDPGPAATDIPRYLRYRAEEKCADDYWDGELERANFILHNRIRRMDQDKLCVDCARFDWLRTHFYTRECKRQGEPCLGREDRKLQVEEEFPDGPLEFRSWPLIYQKTGYLDGIEDDVQWCDFEFASETQEEAKGLAQHPRFRWFVSLGQRTNCTLCNMLSDSFSPLLGDPRSLGKRQPNEVSVQLYRNVFCEQQTGHYCRRGGMDVGRTSSEWPNALRADGWLEEGTVFSCHIRPVLDDRKHIFDAMPHCCVWQRTPPNTVDFSLMAGWLNRCDEQHEHGPATFSSKRELKDLRLIDVHNQCIIKSNTDTRYAALSYTWGSRKQYCLTKQNVHMLETIGSLSGAKPVLRTILVDSMKVCTALGIRYIWVDSLCIIQDDEASKHTQIQNMDVIYAKAYITLVDASEPGPLASYQRSGKEGLQQRLSPGSSMISTRDMSHARTFVIDNVSYNCSAQDLGEALRANFENSVWFSRGWTLQELALSRRMLVFTANEAFFYCSEGILAESFCHGGDQYNSLSCESPNSIELCGALHRQFITMGPPTISNALKEYDTVYLPLLNAYLKRVLTYDSDRLNAFSGIISILGESHWGLPLHLFTRALLLPLDVFHPSQLIPFQLSPHQHSNSPEFASEVRIVHRLLDFPSWSWAGWKPSFEKAEISVGHIDPFGNMFRPVILIHVYSDELILSLLSEPRIEHFGYYGEKGKEGYCTMAIARYNDFVKRDPLPLHSTLETEFPPPKIADSISHLLVFWSHVARFPRYGVVIGARSSIWSLPEGGDSCEVVLVGLEYYGIQVPVDRWFCRGVIIRRRGGFVERIGSVGKISMREWIQAEPQLELIFLA